MKKMNENKDALSSSVAQVSANLAARYVLADENDRNNIRYAQALLNQAQMVVSTVPGKARTLLSLARRVSKVKKVSEKKVVIK